MSPTLEQIELKWFEVGGFLSFIISFYLQIDLRCLTSLWSATQPSLASGQRHALLHLIPHLTPSPTWSLLRGALGEYDEGRPGVCLLRLTSYHNIISYHLLYDIDIIWEIDYICSLFLHDATYQIISQVQSMIQTSTSFQEHPGFKASYGVLSTSFQDSVVEI